MTAILVVLTFAFFLGLDWLLERRKAPAAVSVKAAARSAGAGVPPLVAEPVWVAGYQLPEELHYHRGHTWARVLEDGAVAIGLDDFARKLVGAAGRVSVPHTGAQLAQGAPAFRLEVDGRGPRAVDLVAPLDGEVLEVNPRLEGQPQLATDEPYGRGWILKLRPRDLARDLRNLFSGSLARRWMEDSRERLELELVALSGSVLQDGGEPASDFVSHLPDEDWRRLVRDFLLA